MANLGNTDFSMKPQVDISSIASVLQKKAIAEQEMKMQQRQQRMQEVGQTISLASGLVSNMVASSQMRQKKAFVNALSDSMAAGVPNVMAPQEGPGVPKDPNNFDLGEQPLPPVSTPNFNRQNQIRAAVQLDPKQAADSLLKSTMPTPTTNSEQIKTYQKPDGTLGYARINKMTGAFEPISGITATGVSATDRANSLKVQQENADARSTNATTGQNRFVTTTGDKLAQAVDPTKLRDYDRLTAGKRLDQFVKSTAGKATEQQVVEASSLLASMLQGGGRGGVVSENIIKQLTPSTLKGSAMDKLQWLTNNPQNVDKQKFLDLFQKTADREAGAAEDNIRQQQVEQLKKYEKVKRLDPKRYKEIQDSIGLTDENVGADGRFKRTANTRSILPNYMDNAGGGISLGNGFSYTVK